MKKIVPDPPPLFSANPDLDPHRALVHVTMLLSCAYDSAQECATHDGTAPRYAWLTMHAVEAAKGLIDSLLEGMERAEWRKAEA